MKKQEILTGAVAGPYSPAVATEHLIFVSGQIPLTAGGALAEGIEAQARQAIENLRSVLKAGEADLENVVKTTVFLVNLGDFDLVNRVYAEYFAKPYPARSCVEVSKLPKGALVEIEAVAAV